MNMNQKIRLFVVFVLAFLGLLLLNVFIVAILSRSLDFALEQFSSLKVFLIPIAISFGLQAVLYYLIKEKSSIMMLGSGSMNTGTMIACCAHHVADLFPFLAIGGLSSFLVYSQKYLLLGALILNWLLVLFLYKKFRGIHEK